MKKLVLCVAITASLILAAGCGGGAAPPGFTQADFYLSIDGAEYRCDDNIEAVLARLGPDYGYSEGLSCAYDSVDKTFSYEQATFYTNPLPEGDLISEIYTEDPEVSTSRGVTVGMTEGDVLAAYGEDRVDMGSLLIYRVPGAGGEAGRGSLCFEMENGMVIAIFVTTEPV